MSLLDSRYIYCASHGAVHVFKEGTDVWCPAAQDSGLDLREVSYMQSRSNWTDTEALDYARQYCKHLGLWLYNAQKV